MVIIIKQQNTPQIQNFGGGDTGGKYSTLHINETTPQPQIRSDVPL